jgi:hypothetical protein
VKYELRGRHINRGRVEVGKEEEKKERSKGKSSRWKRRSRKIKHQRRGIMDNSASGKRHQWILWSTSHEKRRKDRLVKP